METPETWGPVWSTIPRTRGTGPGRVLTCTLSVFPIQVISKDYKRPHDRGAGPLTRTTPSTTGVCRCSTIETREEERDSKGPSSEPHINGQ